MGRAGPVRLPPGPCHGLPVCPCSYAGALLLGIPVYLTGRRHMSQPEPGRPTGDTSWPEPRSAANPRPVSGPACSCVVMPIGSTPDSAVSRGRPSFCPLAKGTQCAP